MLCFGSVEMGQTVCSNKLQVRAEAHPCPRKNGIGSRPRRSWPFCGFISLSAPPIWDRSQKERHVRSFGERHPWRLSCCLVPPGSRKNCLVLCLVPSERAALAGQVRPGDCARTLQRVWGGVGVFAAGFPRCRCLSFGVLPLCYIARPETDVARAWSWAVSHSTREAQRSSELIASRHDAGPFVSNTNLRPQERPIIPAGNGTAARVLCDALMNHVRRPLDKRESIGPNAAFRLA